MGTGSQETGHITGTKDKDYNLIWFTEQCMQNALRLETYAEDAERDGDLRVVDESGEDDLFAADRFVAIEVPAAVKASLLKTAQG